MKRIELFLLGLSAIGGVYCLVLFAGGGVWSPPPPDVAAFRPRATATAEQGKVIVAAIYEFRNRYGLWPCRMGELVPNHVPAESARGWHYTWHSDGWWYLTNYIAFPRWAVRYEKRPDAEGWQLTDGMDGIDLGVEQPRPPLSAFSEEDFANNLRFLMSHRLEAEPGKMLHHQGQVSWLYRRGRFAEARESCLRCLEAWPDHWWPNVMLSILDARLGSFEEAEQRLIRYTGKAPDFNHGFLLAHFYFMAGESEKGFAALNDAARLPMRDLTDGWMAYVAPWHAAAMAYRANRYDVALAVCDRWERYWSEENVACDRSFYAIRAACYLALEDFDRARAQAAEAERVGRSRRLLTENVEELMKAIELRDTTYVHDIGDSRPFTLLIDYE